MAVSQSLSVTQVSQDVAANTSKVRIRWTSTQSGSSWNGYTRTAYYYISVNGGAETRYSVSYTLPQGKTQTIVDTTITVNHKSDGAGKISVRTWMDTDISAGVIEKSQSLTLTTIPRATTPTMSNPTMGSTVTISLPRASSGFTHTLTYKFGSASGTIATGAGTSISWAVPLSLVSQVPNAVSGTGTLTCKTYNGSTLIGTKSISFTASVPASVVPAISEINVAEATEGLAAKFEAYVQNKSTLAVSISAAGARGSTITKCETVILGVKYTGASFTSQALTASGTITVSVTVTDSRARTATKTQNVTVLPYFEPRINGINVWRITTEGTAADDGPRIAVQMNFELAQVGGSNDRVLSLQIKKESDPDTSFTQFYGETPAWARDGTQYFKQTPVVSSDYAYTLRLVLSDYFGSTYQDFAVPTAFAIMDFRSTGKGLAVGKVSEKDALEVAMDAYFYDDVNIDGDTTIRGDLTVQGHDSPIGTVLYNETVGEVSVASGKTGNITSLDIPAGVWVLIGGFWTSKFSGASVGGSLRITLGGTDSMNDKNPAGNIEGYGSNTYRMTGSAEFLEGEVMTIRNLDTAGTVYLNAYHSANATITFKGSIRAVRIA